MASGLKSALVLLHLRPLVGGCHGNESSLFSELEADFRGVLVSCQEKTCSLKPLCNNELILGRSAAHVKDIATDRFKA